MPNPNPGTIITIRLNIRGGGDDDYGFVLVEIPVSNIDWSLADKPRSRITLADIYELVLQVGRPGETPETSTWDRD